MRSFRIGSCLTSIALATVAVAARWADGAESPDHVVWENDLVRYVLSADAKNAAFVDKRTGADYLAPGASRPFAVLVKDGRHHVASGCQYADGTLTVQFPSADITVVVKVAVKPRYLVFEVQSVSDPEVAELVLGNLVVRSSQYTSGLSGVAADDEFAVALRTLDLQALGSVGGSPATLAARCFRQYGMAGARWALVGCPADRIRPVLQEVIQQEGLPQSPLGGPWALDAPENRGSYVFASVSEQNVDQWIALAQRAGLAQIHFIGWERSLGHYEPRADLFPNGLSGLKATVEKIHAAGLKAGMHTLTGCISPHDPWVTPVPDPRLAKDASFTLAEPLDETQDAVRVHEQPPEFDTIWAYAARGNVIQIDQELIQFSGLSREPPYGFTGCRRGVFGTKPAPHAQGAPVHHLFVRYGAFLPDENSTLVDDVAEAIARVFNACGFDMIYMDGAEGMSGGWRGVARMREAIFRKLTRRVLVEASEWGYPSWPFHSRIGAWDHPNWALKRFVDIHCRATEQYRRSALLPAQLGWWAILGPSADHPAETRDEIEYLCVKALALDAPLSFQGVHVGDRPANARQNEFLDLIRRYERLRLAGQVSDAVRQRLRAEREEFRLVDGAAGEAQFVPTDYAAHKVTALDDGSATWVVHNRFASQPIKLRIEVLYGAAPYDSADSLLLADFGPQDAWSVTGTAPGVAGTLEVSSEHVKAGAASGRFVAQNAGALRRGAWVRATKTFAPHANLAPYGALGLWVHGDGKGQLLNIQLTNPPQYWPTYDEHYITIDFTGWRYFELLLRERDAETYGDYVWPYGDIYSVYRSPLIRNHVSSMSLYYNALPAGDSAACYLSPIKALKAVKLDVVNPAVSVGSRRLVFPVKLQSGHFIEMQSPSDCTLYDERGAVIERFEPQGEVPTLAEGQNQVSFTCQGSEGLRVRAMVTVISSGEPL